MVHTPTQILWTNLCICLWHRITLWFSSHFLSSVCVCGARYSKTYEPFFLLLGKWKTHSNTFYVLFLLYIHILHTKRVMARQADKVFTYVASKYFHHLASVFIQGIESWVSGERASIPHQHPDATNNNETFFFFFFENKIPF